MRGAGLSRFLRPALPVALLFAALLAAVACVQDEPPPPNDTIVPLPGLAPGWAGRLARDIQALTGDNSETLFPRIRDQEEAALSQSANPAVNALLGEMLEIQLGPVDPHLHLGLALDVVGRVEGAGTVQITPMADGLLILTGGRHPYVAEVTAGVPVTFEAVPRYASLPVKLMTPTGCSFTVMDASNGVGAVAVEAPDQLYPDRARIVDAWIEPTGGPGTSVVELRARSSLTILNVLAWSPQIGRGVWLTTPGGPSSVWSEEYALPALGPGSVEWKFEAFADGCARGPGLAVEFKVT